MPNQKENPNPEQERKNLPGNSAGDNERQAKILEEMIKRGLPGEEALLKKGEITNNDGSVVETLDTAFHNQPGMIKSHSIAGSNRADYYEAQSDGKSDAEEEVEYLKNKED